MEHSMYSWYKCIGWYLRIVSSVKATHERKENPLHITMAIYYYHQGLLSAPGAEIVQKYLTDDAVTMYLQL